MVELSRDLARGVADHAPQRSTGPRADYQLDRIAVSETGRANTFAVWKGLEEIKAAGAKLYPDGLEHELNLLGGR